MGEIKVDYSKCHKDGLCIKICPMRIITENEDGFPIMKEGKANFCLECGQCEAICPHQTLKLVGEHLESGRKDLILEMPSLDSVEYLVKKRRSVRSFKSDPVARETMERVLEVARYAPTAKNAQPINWMIIENKDLITKLINHVTEIMKEKGLLPGVVKAWEEKGIDLIFRNAPGVMIAYADKDSYRPAVDCSIATTTAELYMSAAGVGSCWAGFFMTAADDYGPLYETLGISEEKRIYCSLMYGYPKMKLKNIPPRNRLNVLWK